MQFAEATNGKVGVGRLVWPITAIMVAVAALLIALTFYSGWSMDRASIAKERALVDNAVSGRLARGLGEIRSVAWWDDAVLNSSKYGFDKAWLDREVGSYMEQSYGHDRLVILDEADRPIYAYGEGSGLGTTGLIRDVKLASPIIRQARGGANVSPRVKATAKDGELYETAKGSNRRFSRGFGAVMGINNMPVLVMASLITPSFDVSHAPPTRRLIISFVEITPAVLSEIGSSSMLPDLSFEKQHDNRSGVFSFNTDLGQPLADIRWTPKLPGTAMVKAILPYILGTLLVTSILLSWLVSRLFGATKRLAQREIDAQHLANHDALTSLPNRRHLEQQLFERSSIAEKGATRLACAVIDLDRFKDINDTLGHAAGDALIKAVAMRLRDSLRDTDFVARLGGDEFAILRDCTGLLDAEDLSSRIAAVFAKPFPVMGHDIETAASVGVSMSAMNRAVEDLMREADIALYEAKAKQKGTTVQFAPAMASKIEQRRTLEMDLKIAIAQRSLTMAYQPIVEATSGIVTSVEALVRWSSPKHGMVPPDVFVAIAEETGMMAELGRFVIEQSIEDSKRWPKIKTSINISPAQLRSASIVQDLMRPTKAQGVSPMQIILEITETVLMSNDQRTLHTLNILKEQGFSLALDDFGTGYSSLAYVRDFPFDKLKIDRSFVQGQKDKGRSLDIVKAVVNFGRVLGREVVAEGIETEAEMQAMQRAGVTHLQGYLFSKPISAAHLEALIATSGRLTAARTARELPELTTIDRSLATKLRHVA
jgi:diguanylate cyclase (GGDEF)-like protein